MDEVPYKEVRNTVQAFIKDKKTLQEKLSENIRKRKELWKIIKKWILTGKKNYPRIIINTFKEYFVNLANDLVKKRPDSTGKLGLLSVR